MKKNEKIIASSLVFVLAITFIIRAIAIGYDLEGIKVFFGIQNSSNKDFFYNWFGIGSIIWLGIGALILCIPKSKAFRIISMVPLCSYGFLQLMGVLAIMAFSGDNCIIVDVLWFTFTTLLSFTPMAIIGSSLD